jgi:hypothetical protein
MMPSPARVIGWSVTAIIASVGVVCVAGAAFFVAAFVQWVAR